MRRCLDATRTDEESAQKAPDQKEPAVSWWSSGPVRVVVALVAVSGADLDVLVMVDELTGFHKSGPMSSIRPTSWGSARNRRDRTGREAVKTAGVVLGYRASWHGRGPGERHDDGARSRGRGHPQPQTGLDRNGS